MNKMIIYSLVITFYLITNTIAKEIKILYKINDNIITNHDIIEEINYLVSLNQNLSQLDNEQLSSNASQSLIREKIKKDEIDKFYSIDYEKAIVSKDLDLVIKNFRTNLGFETDIAFENYLSNKRIDLSDLKKKFIIEQTWNKLIVDKFLDQLKIDQEEIEKKVDFFMENNSEQLSLNLSEIIFLEKNKTDNEKKYQEILKSIKEVGFRDTAILHSIADSSKFGGEIGWVNQSQISNEIFNYVEDLEEGQFTNPINSAAGILILKLNEKKMVSSNINRGEEINKLIVSEKNRKLNEYSVIHYKQLENKSYVKKF